jgi:uncharacterized protein
MSRMRLKVTLIRPITMLPAIRAGLCTRALSSLVRGSSVRLDSIAMESKSKLKRAAIHVTGWFFILVGIIGLVLPVLQGILFILVGLFLLSSVSPRAERLLRRIRKRFPRISNTFDEAKHKAKHLQSRIAARFQKAKSKAQSAQAQVFRKKHRRWEDLK